MSEDSTKTESQAAFTQDDVVTDSRIKDQEEFDKAFDEVLDEPKEDDDSIPATEGEGEGQPKTEGQETESDPTEGASQEPVVDGTETARDNTPATEPKVENGIDYKARADELADLLAKEQQRNSTWNGRITAANKRADEAEAKIKELEAKLAEAAKAPKKEAEQINVDGDQELEDFFNDFPEMKKPFEIMLKKALGNKEVDKAGKPETGQKAEVADAPAAADEGKSDNQKVFEDTIGQAHPDWRYHVTTGKLLAWIDEQPEYIKHTLKEVYQGGTARACIDLLTNYKKSTGLQEADGETNPGPKTDPKVDKQKKMDALREVKSSGAKVDPEKGGPKNKSFDDTAKEIGL